MHRRHFLRSTAAAGLAWTALGRGAFAATGNAPLPGNRRLVVVFLRGAVDGLSVVAPYTEGAYYRQRSSIALARPGQDGGLLDLDGHFGLNPNLAALVPLWQSGKLAFVHASGSPDATRSHFDAQDYMESGTPGRKGTPDGWLNRLLGAEPPAPAAAGARASVTRGISVGATLPRIWAGANPVANIPNGPRATRPTQLDKPQVSQAFDALYAGDDAMSRAYRESQQSRAEVNEAMSPAAHEQMVADNGAPLPNGFPDDAGRLAQLMRRDANVQIAFLALGGWDTHVNQGGAKGQLANRLQPLGQGLAEFATRLGPVFDDTTVLVISEFGRTARQNGTGGTDHGHGNVMWALGGNIAGGKVYGRWPGVDPSALYEGRDLAITTDFRQVLAGVCMNNLRLPDDRLAAVFPGFDGAPLNIARA
ncbi:MAG TPA: DUF1501 domain-containing protein [Burkholderiaceae bacterium]